MENTSSRNPADSPPPQTPGNKIKTIIRKIEKEMSQGISEVQVDGVSSKGSRFRKSVFEC